MIVGCYTTDFYCDHPCHDQRAMKAVQITGETYSQTVREIRKRGWKITKDRKAFCPQHQGKKK